MGIKQTIHVDIHIMSVLCLLLLSENMATEREIQYQIMVTLFCVYPALRAKHVYQLKMSMAG